MDRNVDPDKLTDRELLLVMYTKLENHLQHHDMYTKIALSAGLIGIINLTIGMVLIAIRFGFVVAG